MTFQLKNFSAIIFFVFVRFFSFAQDTTSIHYSSLIQPIEISGYLNTLASGSMEGRGTGKEGQKKAAAYIAAQFESFGLKPISNGSFFQQHPLSTVANQGKNIEVNQQYFLFKKDYFS